MYSATRCTSAQRRYAAPAHGSPRRSGSRSKRGSWTTRFQTVFKEPWQSCSCAQSEVAIALSARRGSQICYDFKLGRCNRGSGCKFSHNLKARSSSPTGFAPRSKSPISKESGICFYYGRGSCTRGDKCPYKHVKPGAPAESTNVAC